MLGQLGVYKIVLVVASAFSVPSHHKPFENFRVPSVYAAQMLSVHLVAL
jgi:hypothetical protein